VDKVVGYAILNGVDLSRCMIGCTGRQPAGMIKKDANAGIPVVISRAASTDKGIAAADTAGITRVCFSRGDRFTIYTHPERIRAVQVPHLPDNAIKQKLFPVAEKMELYKTAGTGNFVR